MSIFKRLELSDKKCYDNCLAEADRMNSISDFAFFWLWNLSENVYIACVDNLIVMKGYWGNKCYFYSPSLYNKETFEKCWDIANAEMQGEAFCFAGVPEYIYQEIKDDRKYSIEYDRNASDYVYLTSDLAELKGKKFHAKKNFVNYFKKNYNYTFVDYDEANRDEILALYNEWSSRSESADSKEKIAIVRALDNYKELGLYIGLLYVDGKLQAFSVSSKSQFAVAQVYFEKGNTDYKGIYQMINYLTVNNYLMDTEYINREEDMGIENLRKAKLSLNPYCIYNKYIVKSGVDYE